MYPRASGAGPAVGISTVSSSALHHIGTVSDWGERPGSLAYGPASDCGPEGLVSFCHEPVQVWGRPVPAVVVACGVPVLVAENVAPVVGRRLPAGDEGRGG